MSIFRSSTRKTTPYDLVPQATFSGVTGAVSTAYEYRFPINGREMPFTTSTNMTSNHGKHVFKGGFAAERWRANKGEFGSTTGGTQGIYRFDRDTTNPNDSNHPFSNALLGNFASYSEVTSKVSGYFRNTNMEWFAQDNWRASKQADSGSWCPFQLGAGVAHASAGGSRLRQGKVGSEAGGHADPPRHGKR